MPDKKNYRYFKIRSLEGAIDDFGAVREAVARRYTRLVNEGLDLPDLVLIDGGAGQVSAAKEILDALGVDSDLAGLAKQNEEIYLPGRREPVVLPKDSPALRVLVAVRDETHRFATGLNQKLRASDLQVRRPRGHRGRRPGARAQAHARVRLPRAWSRPRRRGHSQGGRHGDRGREAGQGGLAEGRGA